MEEVIASILLRAVEEVMWSQWQSFMQSPKKKEEVDIKNTHALNRHREAKIERSMKPRRKQKPYRAHVT